MEETKDWFVGAFCPACKSQISVRKLVKVFVHDPCNPYEVGIRCYKCGTLIYLVPP